MYQLTLFLLFVSSLGLAEELIRSDNYQVTITQFEPNELKIPEIHSPLYCKITPKPREPVLYQWRDTITAGNYLEVESSPYALYNPLHNYPKFGTLFCHVKTQAKRQELGHTSILLNIQGYLEAKRGTFITFQPPESLWLETEVQEQYIVHQKSPLVNMTVWTKWTHNNREIGVINKPTLYIEKTTSSTAGTYRLEVSHFFPSLTDDHESSSGEPNPDDMYCSGVILDAMQLYALFSPVQFQVNLLGSTEGLRSDTHQYEFFENKSFNVRIQIHLTRIRGLDLHSLSEHNKMLHVLLHNGKLILGGTFRTSFRKTKPILEHNYHISNIKNTAQVELNFESLKQSSAGIYEYQLYVNITAIQNHLNNTMCSDVYKNFIPERVRLSHLLIGKAVFNAKIAGRIIVNTSKTNLTADDNEGSNLVCSLVPQRDENIAQLRWFKNGRVVADANSSILYLNTSNINGDINKFGMYTCKYVDPANGQEYTQTTQLTEKVSFSLQLNHQADNRLECERMSTEAMSVLMSELRALFSQACDCNITTNQFGMAAMSCDSHMLTMRADLIYSNDAGNVTASNLLEFAASRLMGVMTVNEEAVTLNTNCPIRNTQGACIVERTSEPDQFTTLAISLLVILCLLIAGVVVTVILLCLLKKRQGRKDASENPNHTLHNNSEHPTQNAQQTPVPLAPVHSNAPHTPDLNITEPQAYCYPLVHSVAGSRRVTINRGRGNQVMPSSNRRFDTGDSASRTNIPPFSYISNQAYTANGNNQTSCSSFQRNIQNRAKPLNGVSVQDHIYDYPSFENEGDESMEGSSTSYMYI